MRLTCSIKQVYDFYQQYPQHKNTISVDTPYGYKKIIDVYLIQKEAKCLKVSTRDYSIICSPEHRIMKTDWIFAKDTNIGDFIQTKNGRKRIIEIRGVQEKQDLYDISVDEVEQYYSNGILSHNSSALLTIPFALYGKTDKDIRKEQIINWKNKKKCEVMLSFALGSDEYSILRALKPDKLEIYKNGSLIEIPSDIRTYQKTLENDILRSQMDFNMFMYLIYTNLNSSTPILRMTKPQKRTFLENLFGLELYTKINELANKKLAKLDETIFKIQVEIDQNESTISSLKEQSRSFNLKKTDITEIEKELKKKIENLEVLEKDSFSEENYEEISNIVKKREKELYDTEIEINTINNKIQNISYEIKIDKENIEKFNKQKITKSKEIILLKGDISSIDKDISNTADTREIDESELNTLIAMREDINSDLSVAKHSRKQNEEKHDILKDGRCPTCGTKISTKTLQNKYLSEIERLDNEIESYTNKLVDINNKIDEIKNTIKSIKSNRDAIDKLKIKKSGYEIKLKLLSKDDVSIDIKGIESKINKSEEEIGSLNNNKTSLLEKRDIIEKKLIEEKNNQNKIKESLDKIKVFRNEIKQLEDDIKSKKGLNANIEKIIQENGNKIIKAVDFINKNTQRIERLKNLLDYLNYIKFLCKDENVKRFSISSTIPYLEKQVNYYLSESGSSHYIKFDNWLEAEIFGSGITSARYENLSSGEARSIDLSNQFAFLDIAKIRAGIFPDVLLLDEILDSSIDSFGINNILRIIKTKQFEDESKVFIITHRSELSDVEIDNIYMVEKIDGFSQINKI